MKNSKQGFLPSKVPKLLHKYQENTQENIINMLSKNDEYVGQSERVLKVVEPCYSQTRGNKF